MRVDFQEHAAPGGEAADPVVSPEVVEEVLEVAAELHAEELTRLRRSDLFEAAAQAGIPAKFVAAALRQVSARERSGGAAGSEAAGHPMGWFFGYVAYLFVLSLAGVWLAGLLSPRDARSTAAGLAAYALIWLVGAVTGVLVIDSAHSRPGR
ncbi:MAG TPA: hypothetical protein VF746_30970 [Longimicrobium sp.]|jgi:hypothetical protein